MDRMGDDKIQLGTREPNGIGRSTTVATPWPHTWAAKKSAFIELSNQDRLSTIEGPAKTLSVALFSIQMKLQQDFQASMETK
jgi:hypothetical protein